MMEYKKILLLEERKNLLYLLSSRKSRYEVCQSKKEDALSQLASFQPDSLVIDTSIFEKEDRKLFLEMVQSSRELGVAIICAQLTPKALGFEEIETQADSFLKAPFYFEDLALAIDNIGTICPLRPASKSARSILKEKCYYFNEDYPIDFMLKAIEVHLEKIKGENTIEEGVALKRALYATLNMNNIFREIHEKYDSNQCKRWLEEKQAYKLYFHTLLLEIELRIRSQIFEMQRGLENPTLFCSFASSAEEVYRLAAALKKFIQNPEKYSLYAKYPLRILEERCRVFRNYEVFPQALLEVVREKNIDVASLTESFLGTPFMNLHQYSLNYLTYLQSKASPIPYEVAFSGKGMGCFDVVFPTIRKVMGE